LQNLQEALTFVNAEAALVVTSASWVAAQSSGTGSRHYSSVTATVNEVFRSLLCGVLATRWKVPDFKCKMRLVDLMESVPYIVATNVCGVCLC
jgi:hypothetical protein